MMRWSAASACALALGSFAGEGAAQEASCDCSGRPPSFVESLRDDGVEALVLAYVAFGEGSPRGTSEVVDAGKHPFPWLRYLMITQRSWKGDLKSFWLERPWARCGSVLWPGQPYLVAVPRHRDDDATVLRGMSDVTITACEALAPAAASQEQIAALGAPRFERDLRSAIEAELSANVTALIDARRPCWTADPSTSDLLDMTPGEWSTLSVRAAGREESWRVGQHAFSREGRDEVLLAATNSGPCWLRIEPDIRSRWAVEGSARRLLPSRAGLTFREGWLPPYWQGVLTLGDHPWIRRARWQVTALAKPPIGPGREETVEQKISTRHLQVIELRPEPGSYIGPGSTLRGRLRWTGELATASVAIEPVFEASGNRLIGASLGGRPVEWPVTEDHREVQIELPLAEVFATSELSDPPTLRFVVETRPREVEGVALDSTGPVVYLRGEEPPRVPVPAPERGVWYAGGGGETCQDAIVIRGARSVQEGIAAERAWWRQRYPGSRMIQQGVSPPSEEGRPAYDSITVALPDGTEKTVCFEITEFWGASPRLCGDDTRNGDCR
jgi:hypothetical protein